jgi:hypothetical protein
MRQFFAPADAPLWLKGLLNSIREALSDVWSTPFRLKDYPTADLPPAADWTQGLAYDSTTTTVKYSQGSSWIGLMPTTGGTFSGDISVPDEAYGAGWNGSLEVPTKNALYDKIETLGVPDPIVPADGTQNITGGLAVTTTFSCNGNATLGDGVADVHTVNGLLSLAGNTAYPGAASGVGRLSHNNVDGLTFQGEGSSFDISFINKNGSAVITVQTGTQHSRYFGNLQIDGKVDLFGNLNLGGGGWTGGTQLFYTTTNGTNIYGAGSSTDILVGNAAGTTILTVPTGTVNMEFAGNLNVASGKVYKVAGTQVVGAQGAAVADATDAASAITQLNALLARCRSHGLIAT